MTEEKEVILTPQQPYKVVVTPYVSDGAPEQHINAQEQIPNPRMLKAKAEADARAKAAELHKPAETKPVEETKAAEATPERAVYKTREAKPKAVKDEEDEKKT